MGGKRRALEFTPGFQSGSCYSIFSFICMFCRSLFVLLYFFFWPLCCLSDSPCYLMTINHTCNSIAILRAICTVCSFTTSDYPFWYFQTCLLYMDVLLPTRPEHLSSPLVFSGVRVTRSLVLSVCFVDRSLSVCTFSFGHCVVCPSAINPVVSSNSSFSNFGNDY